MLAGAILVVGDSTSVRSCIAGSWALRNGGNQWASWCCFLSFVRDSVGWISDTHTAYEMYERCAIHSGPRYMHNKFCIVSDFPIQLADYIDRRGIVAHNDDGPSHLWSDGFAIWTVHGVAVDQQIVMEPATQTIHQIENEQNAEVKRIRIERYGWERYLSQAGAKVVDQRHNDRDAQDERLYILSDGGKRFQCVDPSTGRRYVFGVPSDISSCEQAQTWISHGLDRHAIHRS